MEKELSPEEVVIKQLAAYNKGDIETFVSCFREDIQTFTQHDNKLLLNGMAEFKERYQKMFEENPQLNAELLGRMVLGNFVIDHERVTGNKAADVIFAIAIYEVEAGIIKKAWFIR